MKGSRGEWEKPIVAKGKVRERERESGGGGGGGVHMTSVTITHMHILYIYTYHICMLVFPYHMQTTTPAMHTCIFVV
jgi:hypothetical protein